MNFGTAWMRKASALSPTTTTTTTGGGAGVAPGTGTGIAPAAVAVAASGGSALASVWSNASSSIYTKPPSVPVPAPVSASPLSASSGLVYSRDFILSFYTPQDPFPAHLELEEPVVSLENLMPLAHIPLTENEKKLLSMPSVNSDLSRRGTYNRDPNNPNARNNQRNNRNSRTDRTGSSTDKARTSVTQESSSDLWDNPSGVGTFGSNGFFSSDVNETPTMMEPLEMDLKASHTDSPQRIRSPNDKQSSVGGDSTEFYNNQQQHKSSSRVGSPVTASPKRTLSGHTDDIFGNNLMRPANANQQQPQFGEFFDDSANTNATPGRGGITASGLSSNPLATYDDIISDRSRMGSSPLNSAVASAARTNSRDVLPVDQSPKSVKWLYRDPSGAVQGPFTSTEMNQWFANGYFSADLPVKRVEDLEYIPLQKLALRSPGQPFDISSSEGFTSPKFLLLSMIQQHQQQQQQNILEHQQSRLAGISLSGSPSPSNNNSFLGGGVGVGGPTEPDFNGLGGFNKSARMPSNPMFGQQQQQQLPINQGPSAAHRMIDPRLPREFMDHDPLLQNPVIGGGAWNENRQPIPWGGADNILIDQQRRMMALQQQQQQMNQNAYPSQFMGPGVNIPPNSFNPHLVDSFNADRRLQQQQQPLLAQNFPGGQPFGPNMGIQMPMQNEQFSHQQQSFMQMQQLQMIMQQQQQLQQQQQQNAFLKQQQEQELLLQQQQQPQQQQEDSKKGPVSPIRTQVQKGPSSLTTPTDMKSSPTSQVSLKHKKEENVTTTSPEKVKSPVSSAPSKIVPEEQQPVVTAATKATKKKKNKENAPESRHEKASSDNNYTEMNESSKPPAAVSSVWSSSSEKPALSLREIQEIEAKKKEERDRERARAAQQALLLEAQQLQEANASIVDSGSVWGAGATAAKAPASSKGKTLAEIMEEEERIKRSKEARISSVSSGAGGIESGGVKRYADSITGPVASFSSAASIVSSVPVASVVAPSSSVAAKIKPANAPPASVAAVVSAAPKAGTGWNTVGKPAKTTNSLPVSVVAPPPVIVPTVVPAKPRGGTTLAAKLHPQQRRPSEGASSQSSADPVSWCRQSLKNIVTSSAFNASEFMQMLMMIDVSDSATIYDICNDTLGGYTSIDSRRFAEEFIRRRRMDASHGGNWETITSGPSSASSSNNISGFETTNKFVVVGKKKKGGK